METRLDLSRPGPVNARRILVTGGTSGFGLALTRRLLREGARVAVCARGAEGLAHLAAAGALAVQADVSRPEDVALLIKEIGRAFGGLDAVVNNAAILPRAAALSMPVEDWRHALDVNLTGPWLVAREARPLLSAGGAIVNLTSGLGWFPMSPCNAYAVTKAGLNMLTRALAQELGPRLRVNAVDPGVARTRMNPTAERDPEEAVPVLRWLVAAGAEAPTGCCWRRDGSLLAWTPETTLGRA